jgi:hypothetical protein
MTFSAAPNFWSPGIRCIFVVSDPHGAQGRDTVLLSVGGVDDPPNLSQLPDTTLLEDDSLTIPFTAWWLYVTDPDDSCFTLVWNVGQGVYLSVESGPVGVTIHPQPDWSGVETLRVVVRDPSGLADTSLASVQVSPVPDPPRIISYPDTLLDASTEFYYRPKVSDPDRGDTVFAISVDGPSWLSVDSTGAVRGSTYEKGRYEVMIIATDASMLADSQSFCIVVEPQTSVSSDPNAVPTKYSLGQNYPNPFNPSTNWEVSIVSCQLTIVRVYDVLGREVATLLNEVKQPGVYTVRWDATGLPSGVYYYRLQSGEFVDVKRMLLVK